MMFSYSKISVYNTCPLQYKFRYVDRINVQQSASQVRGYIIHYVLHKIAHMDIVDFEIVKNEVIKDLSSKYSLDNILQAIKDVEKWYKKFEFVYTIETEKEFSISIGDDIIVGSIDRIDKLDDETYNVIDYKTGTSEYDIENSLQLYIYALATFRMYDAQKVIVSYKYIDNDTTTSNTYFSYEIENIENIIKSYIYAIKNDNVYSPRIGIQCVFCSFNSICKPFQSYLAMHNININSSLVELAQEYVKNYLRQKYYSQLHEQLQSIISASMLNTNLNELETDEFKLFLTPTKNIKILIKNKKE